MPDESSPPTDTEVDSIADLPVLIAADIGTLSTPLGFSFGAIRVRWAPSSTYEGSDEADDRFTTFIVGTKQILLDMIEDMTRTADAVDDHETILAATQENNQ